MKEGRARGGNYIFILYSIIEMRLKWVQLENKNKSFCNLQNKRSRRSVVYGMFSWTYEKTRFWEKGWHYLKKTRYLHVASPATTMADQGNPSALSFWWTGSCASCLRPWQRPQRRTKKKINQNKKQQTKKVQIQTRKKVYSIHPLHTSIRLQIRSKTSHTTLSKKDWHRRWLFLESLEARN